MAIVRSDNCSGTLDSAGLPLNASTMSSPGLSRLGVVAGGDVAYIMINPFGDNGVAPELVTVTAHVAGATAATVLRGTNPDFPQQDHVPGTIWDHGPVAEDFAAFQQQIDGFFTTEIISGKGDTFAGAGPHLVTRLPAPAQWQVNRGDPAAAGGFTASYGLTLPVTRNARPTQGLYPGMMIAEIDTLHLLMWDGSAWQYTDDAPGTIVYSASGTLRPGYVWADGTQYDGSQPFYQDLFSAIGVAYGGGGGALFKVPDCREVVLVGWDFGAGAPSPVRVPGAGTRGATGGRSSVTLTTTELPNHTHSASSGNTSPGLSGSTSHDGDHGHDLGGGQIGSGDRNILRMPYHVNPAQGGQSLRLQPFGPGADPASITFTWQDNAGDHSHSVSGTVASHAHTVTVGATGTGSPFSIMIPFLTCSVMVRL